MSAANELSANPEEVIHEELSSTIGSIAESAKLPSPIGHNINLTKNIYLVDLKNIYFSQSTINLNRSELTPHYLENYPMKFLKINENTFMLINSVGYENDWISVDTKYTLEKLFIPAINTVY